MPHTSITTSKAATNLPHLTNGNIKVEFVDLGEGRFGFLDESDDTDTGLLRFDVSKKEDGEWAEIAGASYCTLIPTNTKSDQLLQLLSKIMSEIHGPATQGNSIKKICERLSWLSPSDITPVTSNR